MGMRWGSDWLSWGAGAPVHRLAVTLTLDNLGGEILWCAAESPRPILHLLGEAKVCVRVRVRVRVSVTLGLGLGLGFGVRVRVSLAKPKSASGLGLGVGVGWVWAYR